MDNRGMIAILALWLTAALMGIGFIALLKSGGRSDGGREALSEAHAVFAAAGLHIVGLLNGAERTPGEIRVDGRPYRIRRLSPATDELILICDGDRGGREHRLVTGWKRVGGTWRAAWWAES